MQHSAVQIRNKLTDAVDACIAAATHEFDTDRQLALLRSATYGKVSIVCSGWIKLHRLLCALLRMSTLHRRVSAAGLAPIRAALWLAFQLALGCFLFVWFQAFCEQYSSDHFVNMCRTLRVSSARSAPPMCPRRRPRQTVTQSASDILAASLTLARACGLSLLSGVARMRRVAL
jgi:hypothetical protein